MKDTLTELMEIIKRLPEKGVEELLVKAQKIKEKEEKKAEKEPPKCPHCEEGKVVKNGKGHGKQTYLCRGCAKSFVRTTKTAMENSHYGEGVWKQVIRDTLNGVALDTTAENLQMHHETAFNMRHKILYSMEMELLRNPPELTGISEADETYILECYKGKKFAEDFHRKPRKHGAVASKPGISDEYICIAAGVEREGKALAVATCRSQPTKEDISRVFGSVIADGSVIICDGAKSYGVLEQNGKCAVLHIAEGGEGFKKINNANAFHSFIKERYRDARGFATKYLGRYSSLFSVAFRKSAHIVDDIYKNLTDMSNCFVSIDNSQSQNLFAP